MALDLAALKVEIQTDPTALGYAVYVAAGNDLMVANLLNEVRATITIPRPDVPPMEMLEAINVQDFVASGQQTILHGAWFESITQAPSLRVLKTDGSDTRLMTNLLRLLTNGSASETRIRALASRTGSRAEQLFGPGISVSDLDVAHALRG